MITTLFICKHLAITPLISVITAMPMRLLSYDKRLERVRSSGRYRASDCRCGAVLTPLPAGQLLPAPIALTLHFTRGGRAVVTSGAAPHPIIAVQSSYPGRSAVQSEYTCHTADDDDANHKVLP